MAVTVKEYSVVCVGNSVIVPLSVPLVDKLIPGGRLVAVYVIVESLVATIVLVADCVLVSGAILDVVNEGKSEYVIAFGKTAVKLFTITYIEYVPVEIPVNRARRVVELMTVVAFAMTDPRIAMAPPLYPVPVIVTYDKSPAVVSSSITPFASVIETLVIVNGLTTVPPIEVTNHLDFPDDHTIRIVCPRDIVIEETVIPVLSSNVPLIIHGFVVLIALM